MTDDARPGKSRIAILGAGPSALACAYSLSATQPLRDKYDITIYTMGWRAGGKGASGRGPYERVQEHGLHVLFGSYHSFFKMMRECYAELDRPEGHPLRTWRDAFKPHQMGVLEDFVEDAWNPWVILFPYNDAVPGDPSARVRVPMRADGRTWAVDDSSSTKAHWEREIKQRQQALEVREMQGDTLTAARLRAELDWLEQLRNAPEPVLEPADDGEEAR